MMKIEDFQCPCGSGRQGRDCCIHYINGVEQPSTAEQLMRSRYTGYVLKDADWLKFTWHPDTCPEDLRLNDSGRWLGLKIKRTVSGGPKDDVGEVEFVARYKINGKGHRLHETSRFVRYDGRWVYLDGEASDK